MKYREKPIEAKSIEAVRWLGNNEAEMDEFLTTCRHFYYDPSWEIGDDGGAPMSLFFPTFEGGFEAKPGDWVIKEFSGGFRLCKPDIFDATYEKVED